ncbi:transposase [Gammaproteobacteria bacterium]
MHVQGVSTRKVETVLHNFLDARYEQNLPEGFSVFNYPPAHRIRLRTTNGLERINREIKRRTRVASIFPNPASCLRLVSALLVEFDEEWMAGKIYLNLNP